MMGAKTLENDIGVRLVEPYRPLFLLDSPSIHP